MFLEQELAYFNNTLNTINNIVIVSHRNPDGDAIGSSLALKHFLEQLNQNVSVLIPNELPDFLHWMPNSKDIIIVENNTEIAQELINNATLIFTLDFNALHRTGDITESLLKSATATFVMIDHHIEPQDYAKYIFSDVNYASTAEMVYDFIEALNKKELINKDIATCLYTGIVTDTGSFKYPSTTAKTHLRTAFLLSKNIETTEIHQNLFDNFSYNRMKLLGKALQNLKFLPKYNTAYITLRTEELEKYWHKKGDTEGIVNYGLNIKGVNFAAIFIENKEEKIIKISFRSQGNFDVNVFARKHFNGGGHKNAAGGKSFLSLEETVNKFINTLAQDKNYENN